MKILLIYPDSSLEEIISPGQRQGFILHGALAEPLALEYLCALGRGAGHQVRLLDLRLEPFELEKTLAQFQPQVIGITGLTIHVKRILAICRKSKRLLPDCKIIVGGHHASLLPEDFFIPDVDYIVIKGGLESFASILGKIESGAVAGDIRGAWRLSEGTFKKGEDPAESDLSQMPLPDISSTARHRRKYFIHDMRPIALLRTSSGCPHRCNFCSLWKLSNGKYYTADPDYIIGHLELIEEPWIFMIDDNPFAIPERSMELSWVIRNSGIKKLYYSYCRLDTLLKHPGLLEAWREVGLARIYTGIEAVFPKQLEEFNKGLERSQIEKGIAVARELGLEIVASFIVNTNFTRRDFSLLSRFIRQNRVIRPMFTVLTPLPGTRMLESFDSITEFQENGRPNWDLFDLQHPVVKTLLPREQFINEFCKLQKDYSPSISLNLH